MNDSEIAVVENTPASINPFEMVNPEAVSDYMENYIEVCEAILEDADYQQIGEKKAKKKSAWRKLATAFRISDEIIDEQLIFDDTDQIVKAKYTVQAYLPNGRSTIGVGVCSIYDKIRYKPTGKFPADKETPSNFELRGRFSNAEHDVPSTAHTRAKNRAIADLIGAGEVSAEELNEVPKQVKRSSRNSSTSDNTAEVTEDKPKKEAPKRRGRKRKTAKAPSDEVTVNEIIETTAKTVTEEDDTATKTKYHEIDNEAVQKCIVIIENEGREVTSKNIRDELFDMYDSNTIEIEDYDEAIKTLE